MKSVSLAVVQKLSLAFFILGVGIMIIGLCIGTKKGLIVLLAGLLVLVGNIIFIAIFSRCPHCGGFIKLRKHYCPYCGNYVE